MHKNGGPAKIKRPYPKLKKNFINRHPRDSVILGALPDRVTVKLSTYFKTVANNATGVLTYTHGYLNCTNPELCNNGTATLVPYFDEWAAFMRKFEAIKCAVWAYFANSELFSVINYLCALNYLPPFANNAELLGYLANNYSTVGVMGGINGNNTCVLKLRIPLNRVSGFETDMADTGLVGNTDGSGPPTNNVYCAYGQDTGTASVSGGIIGFKVKWTIDFMERTTPTH